MELQTTYPEGVPSNLLSWIVFLPMIGMAVIICLPKHSIDLVKKVSLIATGIPCSQPLRGVVSARRASVLISAK